MRSRCSMSSPSPWRRVWREVFRSVLPDRVDTAVLVCPTWWPSPRVERVREAAASHSAKVVVLQRARCSPATSPGVHDGRRDCAQSSWWSARAGCVVIGRAAARRGRRRRQNGGGRVSVRPPRCWWMHRSASTVRSRSPVPSAECLRADGVAVTTVPPDAVLPQCAIEPHKRAHELDAARADDGHGLAGAGRCRRIGGTALRRPRRRVRREWIPATSMPMTLLGRRPGGGEGSGAVGGAAHHVRAGLCPGAGDGAR